MKTSVMQIPGQKHKSWKTILNLIQMSINDSGMCSEGGVLCMFQATRKGKNQDEECRKKKRIEAMIFNNEKFVPRR